MTNHHLLPHLRTHVQRIDLPTLRAQARAAAQLAQTGQLPERPAISKLPGDPLALRGIPVLAPGVGSAIRGTNPEQAATNLK